MRRSRLSLFGAALTNDTHFGLLKLPELNSYNPASLAGSGEGGHSSCPDAPVSSGMAAGVLW
jgi:hypothetical protein